MDIINLLVSLNKISLIALIVIIGFLSYQIYLLKKETGNKKKKPVIPDFKEKGATSIVQSSKILVQEQKTYTRSSRVPIIIGIVLFFIFGLIFILGLAQSKSKVAIENQRFAPTPVINFVASKGITIYNQNWQVLSDAMLKSEQSGQHIIVGLEKVKGSDVDMARIRLNKNKWDKEDITFDYNQKMNVYFKEFIISTGEAFLKFEAELHSKTDGWLGN